MITQLVEDNFVQKVLGLTDRGFGKTIPLQLFINISIALKGTWKV